MKATIGGYEVELTPREFQELTGQAATKATKASTPSAPIKQAQTPATKPKTEAKTATAPAKATKATKAKRAWVKWTEQDIALIRVLAAAGKTKRDAASVVHHAPQAVSEKARELGIQFTAGVNRRWTGDEKSKTITLAKQGKTEQEIATAIGRSTSAVHLFLHPIEVKA